MIAACPAGVRAVGVVSPLSDAGLLREAGGGDLDGFGCELPNAPLMRRVKEAFAPDFYLTEQDLYIELTVMKQSLVTRKNRKLRKLRARYPDVKIKLFYKRDLERLAQHFRLDLVT